MKRPSKLSQRFVTFGLVGGITTGLQYVILFLWMQAVGSWAAIGTFIGYSCSAVVSYLLNYYWTFTSDQAHRQAASRFLAVVLSGLVINASIVAVLADWLKVHYLIAQVIATAVTLATNFLSSELWAFRRRPT